LFIHSTRGIFLTQPTGFFKCKYYFCGLDGAFGAAGAGTVSIFCGAGTADGAVTGAAFPLPDIIEDDDGCPEIYARVKDVSIKTTAALVVSLLKKDVPPPAPKTDWLPLLPKEAPISAPFPDCSNTTPIKNRLTITCKIVRTIIIQYPLTTF
jgi:hypothetical protein